MSNIARIMQMAGSVSNEGGFPVTDNLILLMDANDSASYPGSGTDVYDLSPEGNDGVLTNGVTHNTTYFEFDGDNDYIELGTITTANPLQLSSPAGGGMSISVAIWFDGTGDNGQRIIDKSNSGDATNGWAFYRSGGTPTNLVLQANGSGNFVTPTASISNSSWEIYTVTHDTSDNVVLYKNGSSVYTGTLDYDFYPSVEANARIGSWNHSTGRELNGRIGFIAVHEKPLTSTEVTDVFNHYKDIYGL